MAIAAAIIQHRKIFISSWEANSVGLDVFEQPMPTLASENAKLYILNLRVRFRFQTHDMGVFSAGTLCKALLTQKMDSNDSEIVKSRLSLEKSVPTLLLRLII